MTTYPLEAAGDDVQDSRREVGRAIFAAFVEVVSGEGEWSEQTAAVIRAEGRAWASRGESIDDLLGEVRTMTRRLLDRLEGRNRPDAMAHEVMALRLGDAGRRVADELRSGFFQDGGAAVPSSPRCHRPAGAVMGVMGQPAAASRAVLAVRAPGCTTADVDRAFRRHAGPDVVVLPSTDGVHVLAPAEGRAQSLALARRAHADLAGDAWIAVHWQSHTQARSPGDGDGADGICSTLLAVALAGPPGVYELDDVLVHYGAAESPAVSRRLLTLIEPLLEHPVLWETLTVFIATGGVRHRTSRRLGIHRNTLDRRLRRISQCTGQRTDSFHGLGTLSAALVVHAMTRAGD